MDVSSYASDLNDAEWALLEPLIARSHPAGGGRLIPSAASSMPSSICCAPERSGGCCRMSIRRGAPFSITMRSGARMAPGSM
jgi:transposase